MRSSLDDEVDRSGVISTPGTISGPSPLLSERCRTDPHSNPPDQSYPYLLIPFPWVIDLAWKEQGALAAGAGSVFSRRVLLGTSETSEGTHRFVRGPPPSLNWHRHRVEFLTGPPGPGVWRAPTLLTPSRRPPPAMVSGLPHYNG